MIRLDRKILGVVVVFMLVAMLATPLAVAKPTSDKNNDKFEYFKFECNAVFGSSELVWNSPPTGDFKVAHSRGTPASSDGIVELTVGTETFTMNTEPYSVDYTESFDGEQFFDNDGNIKGWHMRITDAITVHEEGTPIGTIVLELPTIVVMGDMGPSIESGSITGYGTGELKGVHISGIDLGVNLATMIFGREGTITGWPEEITNVV